MNAERSAGDFVPATAKMKIAVLCGGLSPERDVSLSSGRGIADALRKSGHKVVLLDLYLGMPGIEGDIDQIFTGGGEEAGGAIDAELPDLERLKAERNGDAARIGGNVLEICRRADMVFMALHGEDGENGNLQAAFDLFGIPYTGTGPLGSALAMNKGISKELFRHHGVRTPEGIVLSRGETLSPFPLPAVIKPCSGGSSVGVSIVQDDADLQEALAEAFRYEGALIVEQYIQGREFSVAVLDGKPLPVIEICPKSGFYDYQNKYQAGMTDEYCPADLPAELTAAMQAAACRVFSILRLETYARVDFMLDGDGQFYCLEANTLPGMTPLSLIPQEAAATGMDYGTLCEEILRISMEKYI